MDLADQQSTGYCCVSFTLICFIDLQQYFEVLWSLVKITKRYHLESYHLDRKAAIIRNHVVFNGEVFQS